MLFDLLQATTLSSPPPPPPPPPSPSPLCFESSPTLLLGAAAAGDAAGDAPPARAAGRRDFPLGPDRGRALGSVHPSPTLFAVATAPTHDVVVTFARGTATQQRRGRLRPARDLDCDASCRRSRMGSARNADSASKRHFSSPRAPRAFAPRRRASRLRALRFSNPSRTRARARPARKPRPTRPAAPRGAERSRSAGARRTETRGGVDVPPPSRTRMRRTSW